MASNTLQLRAADANLDRRGLLAAFAAAPVATLPMLAHARPAGDSAWRNAVAAYWRASDASDQYHRDYVMPAYDRDDAVRARLGIQRYGSTPASVKALYAPEFAKLGMLEDRHGDLVRRQMQAAEAVVHMPAPDAAALAEKLHIFLVETEGCEISEEWLAAMVTDARRCGGRSGRT